MKSASDAAFSVSEASRDTSVVRDEFLEAFAPLEPVPILPFYKDPTTETCLDTELALV